MDAVERYLAELTVAVGATRRRPPRLLREVRDHLDDAVDAGLDRGLDRAGAQRDAVASFGPVADLAPGYRAALALDRTRHAALALLVVMLLQPLLWGLYQSGAPQPDAASGLLNRLVEGTGMVYLLGCPLLLAILGLALRRADAPALAARVPGGFAATCAGSVLVIAVAMNLVDVALGSITFTLLCTGPMAVPLTLALRGVRLARA